MKKVDYLVLLRGINVGGKNIIKMKNESEETIQYKISSNNFEYMTASTLKTVIVKGVYYNEIEY